MRPRKHQTGKSPTGKPKIKILKANPVARELAEPRFRHRVKESGKRYRRAAQKRQMNAALFRREGTHEFTRPHARGLMGFFLHGIGS